MLYGLGWLDSAPLLFVLLAIVSSYMLLRSARRRTERGNREQLIELVPPRADRGHRLGAPRELLQGEVEMHETARDHGDRFKIVLLEQLALHNRIGAPNNRRKRPVR